jgi:methylthioribose-1-phosphate isomerase
MREYPTRIKPTPTISWSSGVLKFLDQTKLPEVEEYIHTKDYADVIEAIKRLSIRGAPALGCAGAYACALSAYKCNSLLKESFKQLIFNDWDKIANARPTAVNLKWAVEIMKKQLEDYLANTNWDVIETRRYILDCAEQIHADDIKRCDSLCILGSNLIPNNSKVMTICNTGGLCSGGIGTALGCIQYAHAAKKNIEVYVPETRPLLQGARLNTWELERSNIPYKLITDSMAGSVMRDRKIDLVIVGADRIAENGDTANKIGTYNLAVLAKHHNIPFYVAAPDSTVDRNIQSGKNIPVEERAASEISSYTSKVYNPAFDVTPFELIDIIITEKGYWQ